MTLPTGRSIQLVLTPIPHLPTLERIMTFDPSSRPSPCECSHPQILSPRRPCAVYNCEASPSALPASICSTHELACSAIASAPVLLACPPSSLPCCLCRLNAFFESARSASFALSCSACRAEGCTQRDRRRLLLGLSLDASLVGLVAF